MKQVIISLALLISVAMSGCGKYSVTFDYKRTVVVRGYTSASSSFTFAVNPTKSSNAHIDVLTYEVISNSGGGGSLSFDFTNCMTPLETINISASTLVAPTQVQAATLAAFNQKVGLLPAPLVICMDITQDVTNYMDVELEFTFTVTEEITVGGLTSQ